MNILLFILLSMISGLLYHFGGLSKKEGKEKFKFLPIWIFNSQSRDVGVSIIGVLSMLILGIWSWWLILCLFIEFASLTTYWNFKDGSQEKWYHFGLHGLGISIAYLPFVIVTHSWLSFGIRCIFLFGFMSIWSIVQKNVSPQEIGRGIAINVSRLLFLI